MAKVVTIKTHEFQVRIRKNLRVVKALNLLSRFGERFRLGDEIPFEVVNKTVFNREVNRIASLCWEACPEKGGRNRGLRGGWMTGMNGGCTFNGGGCTKCPSRQRDIARYVWHPKDE